MSGDNCVDIESLLALQDFASNVKAVETLANAAREEEARLEILSSGRLSVLTWPAPLSPDMVIQLCRLYGNLCFNNPEGRKLVGRGGLLEALHTSIKGHDLSSLHKSQPKLFIVLPAFLQNLIIDTPEQLSTCAELVELLATHVSQYEDEQDTQSFEDLLLAIAEEEGGPSFFTKTILDACHQIIKISGSDISVEFLTMLIGLCEDERLAKICIQLDLQTTLVGNLDKRLYSLEKEDEEAKSSQEMACELLVVVLGHAQLENIDTAFVNRWLRAEDNQLVSTGLLIMGNLVTSDHNVEQLVTEEVIAIYFSLISSSDPRIRHSLLGCLRNCCVNLGMRQILADKGLATQIIQMECGPDVKVVHSMVSILRLMALTCIKVCHQLASEQDFIRRLVSLGSSATCRFSPDLGQFNVELGRLCSTLLTQTKQEAVARLLIELDCLPFILSLLASSHPILLNQAILPLCIIATFRPLPEKFVEALSVDTFDKLANVVDNAQIQTQIKQNIVKFMESISGQENEDLKDLVAKSTIDRSMANFALKIEAEIAELDEAATAAEAVAAAADGAARVADVATASADGATTDKDKSSSKVA